MSIKKFPIAICAALGEGSSFADVRVRFLEAAHKDTCVITNQGACAIGTSELVIDFKGTSVGLIFDVTGSGEGVEVFQPFELTEGASLLTTVPTISDGDQTATFLINYLDAAQRIAFTIDFDDTKGAREITVSDDEISGAKVSLTTHGKQVAGVLRANAKRANAKVVLTAGPCSS